MKSFANGIVSLLLIKNLTEQCNHIDTMTVFRNGNYFLDILHTLIMITYNYKKRDAHYWNLMTMVLMKLHDFRALILQNK